MPTINLKDARNRDARVRAESVSERAIVRYVDPQGGAVSLRKVLRATAEHSYECLKAAHGGDDEALAAALVAGDPDVDLERIGMFLVGASRVYVDQAGEIVYHVAETEVLRTPTGEVKERRPRKRPEPNADSEFPIGATGRLIAKDEAIRRFVFSSKLQIVHVNGLTYDFLYKMAKELHDAKSLMLLGAGKSGKEPLIFSRHATPHRGFLEGRVDGDRYVLMLHLSKMELKRPVVEAPAVVAVVTAQPPAPAPTVIVQPTEPAQPVPSAPQPTLNVATPVAAAPPAPAPRTRKPSVREVIAATTPAATPPAAAAKSELAPTLDDAKAAKRRRTKSTVDAKLGTASDAPPAESTPKLASKRAPRAKAAPASKPT